MWKIAPIVTMKDYARLKNNRSWETVMALVYMECWSIGVMEDGEIR